MYKYMISSISCFRLTLSLMGTDEVPQIETFHQSLHCLPNSEPREGFFHPSLTYIMLNMIL